MTSTSQTWLATGTIAHTPALRETGKGKAVCNFKLHVARSYHAGGQTVTEIDEFPITAWDNLAKIASSYRKGDLVYLKGYIKYHTWTNALGQVNKDFEIIPTELQLIFQANNGTNQHAANE